MQIWDPGWKKFGSVNRDGKISNPGSGMEKIRIRDPGWEKFGESGIWDKHPGSATLKITLLLTKLFCR